MFNTVYVLESDPAERRWIASALAGQAHALVFLDDGEALLGRLPAHAGDCLLCGTEPDAAMALELVRGLRRRGETLPVVMIGPHSAFRTAVDVARLSGTDFLERPVSVPRLQGALRRLASIGASAGKAAPGTARAASSTASPHPRRGAHA